MLKGNKLIALMTISTTLLGAEYYIKNDSKLELGYDSKFTKKGSSELNLGGIFGDNRELFTFVGAEINGENTIDGKLTTGLSVKKRLIQEIELILNAGYQYKGGYENSIKELLKSRGEWDKKFDKDKDALKEYYHSQGLRFKDEESLFSGIVNYDHSKFKLHSGIIYTAGYLKNNTFRLESFVNIKGKKNNHELEGDINYKLKKDTYAKGGRLKLGLNTTSKLGKVELSNKGKIYLGTLIPNKKNYSILLESQSKYNVNNNLELLGGIGAEVVFKEVESGKAANELKVLYNSEIKFDLKYSNDKLELESNNKIKGRVETKGLKLNAEEYEKNKKDQTIALAYSGNMLKSRLKDFDIRVVGRYAGKVNMKKDSNDAKFDKTEHLLEVGTGLTIEKKNKRFDTRSSIDGRYIFGRIEDKNFSILNLWSDNKAEYMVNERLILSGELNFTSSNRLSILNHNSNDDELLLLADTKGTIDYKINKKLSLTTTIGAKSISLFSQLNNGAMAAASQSSGGGNGQSNKLHLKGQYGYKVYNDNKVKYQVKENIGIVGKLGISYADNITSDKLYESLNKIKRDQIKDKGIEEFSKEDLKKITEEENNFGTDTRSLLLIAPSVEGEISYLNDKLLIKPSLGVDIKANIKSNQSKLEYKATNVKTGLKVEYRW
ncbi:hypothetical protein [Streptobacillus moniliformis]|uniref:hypothetical protein n=1 Tax=Streptobacillus moniliformis TaxID=34105 RepID=UPI0007EEBDDF|nr:hypothetical protein [Streptobacillus moniliformis]